MERKQEEKDISAVIATLWYADSLSLPCDKHGVGHKVLQSLSGLFGPFLF